jgi:mitochondrial fission protein ELM1
LGAILPFLLMNNGHHNRQQPQPKGFSVKSAQESLANHAAPSTEPILAQGSSSAAASRPLVWVFADDRPGNTNQCIGVAEALGFGYVAKTIRHDPLRVQIPNPLIGASVIALRPDLRADLCPPWPDIVIAGGRRNAPIARWVKQQSIRAGQRPTFLVQLMWPGWPAGDFDLICLPSHDRLRTHRNLLITQGAPHRCWPETVSAAAAEWRDQIPNLATLPRPWIAVLVGGSTKRHPFAQHHMMELAQSAEALATQTGGSLLVSTSRRTDPILVDTLQSALSRPHFFYPWTEGSANPYIAMLGLADQLVVTGDSLSMCSEAAAQGKPLFIFAPPGIAPAKHYDFHRLVYDGHYGYPLNSDGLAQAAAAHDQPGRILANPAVTIAATVKDRLHLTAAAASSGS